MIAVDRNIKVLRYLMFMFSTNMNEEKFLSTVGSVLICIDVQRRSFIKTYSKQFFSIPLGKWYISIIPAHVHTIISSTVYNVVAWVLKIKFSFRRKRQ